MTNHELALVNWLANGDTDAPSKTLAFMAGFDILAQEHHHPSNPAEFYRCIKLLNIAPHLRASLHKMENASGIWTQLVANWEEIEQTLIAEVGTDWNSRSGRIAQKTDDLIRAVISGAHMKKATASK